MSKTPEDLRYAESHEWIRVEGDVGTIGITDHAQHALNDIVYVELPKVGAVLEKGDEFGVVESVKSVSDLYLPAGGEVLEVNDGLEDAPETINDDPYGAGWLVKIRIRDQDEVASLLDAKAYTKTLA